MNYFTEQSIELANQRDYLDQLFSVYPLSPDSLRKINPNIWQKIEHSYNAADNIGLFTALLELDLFPIKDGYVPFFKRDKTAIYRNPNTINRICGRVRELGLSKLYERCTQPKETNRQMGPLFRRWINTGVLGIYPIPLDKFQKGTDNVILDGSDKQLQEFASTYLGYTRNKGIDFLAYFGGKYVIGEAKFISDEGGHQNDQFIDAMQTLQSNVSENVLKIAILDGVLYIKSNKKMHTEIISSDLPIMSSLLLRDFLYSI